MKTLELNQMENVEGGSYNSDLIACGISTVSWALGALTVETGLGFALWAVAGALNAYCTSQLA